MAARLSLLGNQLSRACRSIGCDCGCGCSAVALACRLVWHALRSLPSSLHCGGQEDVRTEMVWVTRTMRRVLASARKGV
jgi:hypothetical protein